jgi:hypothetical protein
MEWRNGCNESLTGRSCAEFLGFAESMSTVIKPNPEVIRPDLVLLFLA